MVCIISLFTDAVFLTNLSLQHLLFFVAWRRRADSFLVALIHFPCCLDTFSLLQIFFNPFVAVCHLLYVASVI